MKFSHFFVCVSLKSLNSYILTWTSGLLYSNGLNASDCHTYLVASCKWGSEVCFPLCRWSLLQFCLQLCLDSSVVFVFLACLSMLRPSACFRSHGYTSASSWRRQRAKTAAQRYCWSSCSLHPISQWAIFCLPCFRIRNPQILAPRPIVSWWVGNVEAAVWGGGSCERWGQDTFTKLGRKPGGTGRRCTVFEYAFIRTHARPCTCLLFHSLQHRTMQTEMTYLAGTQNNKDWRGQQVSKWANELL